MQHVDLRNCWVSTMLLAGRCLYLANLAGFARAIGNRQVALCVNQLFSGGHDHGHVVL